MEQQSPQTSQPENQPDSNQPGSAPSPIAAALQREHAEWIADEIEALGETTLVVPREHIVAACRFLKSAPGLEFNFLAGLCGFDRGPDEEPRFEVDYPLF